MAAGLTLSREWLAMFDALPDDTARGRLLRAVSGYALCGIMPKGLTETEAKFFQRMKPTINSRRRSERRYTKNREILTGRREILTLSASKPCDSHGLAPDPLINNKEPLNYPQDINKFISVPTSSKPCDSHGLKASKSKTFVPPTVEEVAAYCRERNNGIDPQHFIDHHEATGWIIGKNKTPVKDWKAVIRQWERYDKETKDKNKPKKRDYSGF